MVSSHPQAAALEEIRGFAARNASVSAVLEPFPFLALEHCALSPVPPPDDAADALFALLAIASRYRDAEDSRGRNAYEGYDLRRKAAAIDVLGRCRGRRDTIEPTLVGLLSSVLRTRYYAAPGGSPDADKFDRDSNVERSEDQLALACVKGLASVDPSTTAGMRVLHAARQHRELEVRTLAIAASAALPSVESGPDPEVRPLAGATSGASPLAESPLTRLYDRFGALPFHDWVPRLLAPDRVRALCGGSATDTRALEREAWCALELPGCVILPACLPHPSMPVESLLGIRSEDAMAIVYGQGGNAPDPVVIEPGLSGLAAGTRISSDVLERHAESGLRVAYGTPALRAMLAAVGPSATPAPARDRVLEIFAASGVRPEWMCLTVVPIPGVALDGQTVRERRSALLDKVAKQRRLVELAVPEILLVSAQLLTQHAFDAFVIAVCAELDRRVAVG